VKRKAASYAPEAAKHRPQHLCVSLSPSSADVSFLLARLCSSRLCVCAFRAVLCYVVPPTTYQRFTTDGVNKSLATFVSAGRLTKNGDSFKVHQKARNAIPPTTNRFCGSFPPVDNLRSTEPATVFHAVWGGCRPRQEWGAAPPRAKRKPVLILLPKFFGVPLGIGHLTQFRLRSSCCFDQPAITCAGERGQARPQRKRRCKWHKLLLWPMKV
jgi:hypothetical protein